MLRAAAMGSVALVGLGSRGRDTGIRALGVAVLVLLLLDPWLALSVGFALSALATAGILFLGPPFRDALATWLPRWAAEALAVPFAAQLACTPVVAAISGQVSLVAVRGEPRWSPRSSARRRCSGCSGGVLMLVVAPAGPGLRVAGRAAAPAWIITVATHLAPAAHRRRWTGRRAWSRWLVLGLRLRASSALGAGPGAAAAPAGRWR